MSEREKTNPEQQKNVPQHNQDQKKKLFALLQTNMIRVPELTDREQKKRM